MASPATTAVTDRRYRCAYAAAHEQLYRGRLWVNRIARTAVLSPRATSMLLRAGLLHPRLLAALTTKIVRV